MKNYITVRNVLRASAVATLIFGLALLVFSSRLVSLIDNGGVDENHFAVYLGTSLIGFSVSNWIYSNFKELSAIRPAIIGNQASLISASIIDVVFLIKQPTNIAIWLILLMHIAFVSAFAYCLFNTESIDVHKIKT